MNYIDWFSNIKIGFPCYDHIWSYYIILCIYCWILFNSLRIFVPTFMRDIGFIHTHIFFYCLWFWYQGISFINELENVPSSSIFQKRLHRIGVNSSLIFGRIFQWNNLDLEISFERVFKFNFLNSYRAIQMIYFTSGKLWW